MRLSDVLNQKVGKVSMRVPDYRCTVGAHRGSSVSFRENTLEAFEAADRDDRFAFVEFDVQYTRDRAMVVFHDKWLLRLYGKVRTVGRTDLSELEELTNGEIALYEEVMEVVDKRLNIEIKSQGDDEEDRRLADAIVADVRARGRDDEVLISSISPAVISYMSNTYPEVPTGQIFWLTSSTYLHFDSLTTHLYNSFRETQADYLMLHVANLRNIEGLLKLKPKGKTIVFWDFDDTMYIVHKDLSDRLWGDSLLTEIAKSIRYKPYPSWPGSAKSRKLSPHDMPQGMPPTMWMGP